MDLRRFSYPVFVILLIISCGSSSTGPSGSQGSEEFYPLTVGNTWNLSLTGFTYKDSLGQNLDIDGTLDWIITSDTTHTTEGYQLFLWQETSILEFSFGGFPLYTDSLTFTNYVADVDSVIRAYYTPSSSLYRIWMKYPVAVNDWWYSDPDYPTRIMTVLALDSSVTVPAGTFSCLYIQQTEAAFPESFVDYFYASGVGPIKYIVHIEEQQNIYHSIAVMESYSII